LPRCNTEALDLTGVRFRLHRHGTVRYQVRIAVILFLDQMSDHLRNGDPGIAERMPKLSPVRNTHLANGPHFARS